MADDAVSSRGGGARKRSVWRFVPWIVLLFLLRGVALIVEGTPYGEYVAHALWWTLVLLLMAFPGPRPGMPRLLGLFLVLWILSVPAMAVLAFMAFQEHHQLAHLGIPRGVGSEGLRVLGVLTATWGGLSLLLATTLLLRSSWFRVLLAVAALFRLWVDFSYRLQVPGETPRILLALDISLTMLCWLYLDAAFRKGRALAPSDREPNTPTLG